MNEILISYSFPKIFDLFHIFKEFIAYLCVGMLEFWNFDSTTCSKYCGDLQTDKLSHHLLTYPALGSKLIPIKSTNIFCSPVLFIKGLTTIVCHVFPM